MTFEVWMQAVDDVVLVQSPRRIVMIRRVRVG